MDPGFNYAASFKILNYSPTTAGTDPYSAMLGGVIYGALPTDKEPFDATINGELYEANWANYALNFKALALNFVQNGLIELRNYSDICNYLMQYKQGCQLAVLWYESFNTPNPDGTLPAPSGKYTKHCVAVYEDNLLGLRLKPWLGTSYGVGGYCFMSETTFNLVFMSASGFNPQASRWTSLISALVIRWYLLSDIYTQLYG